MTLKEILKKETEQRSGIFISVQTKTDLEKLIEKVAQMSYRKGCIDFAGGIVTYESADTFWKQYKTKFLG
jgi:hypothetical protein